jgi:MFS family permease
MKTTRRRYWVFFLLFLFNLIAYVDRVNMSVAGKPIAQEFGLSPVALGYLFSSFLWAYVLMMLPGGRLIDRWGAHVMASIATAVWSAAQMATGAASSFATMLVTRLGLGIGEAPFAPVTYRSVRAWAPYTERGTAIGAISAGSSLGLALGAPLVAWLIEVASWRWSFIITGAVGFVWVVVWLALVSTPEKTGWLPEAERQRIFAERDAGVEPPSHGGVGYLGLIRCPAMWGLFVSQGCLVYSVYLYMTWLPNYLQTARGLSLTAHRPLADRAGHLRQVRWRDDRRDDLALLVVPRRVHRDEAFLAVLEGDVFQRDAPERGVRRVGLVRRVDGHDVPVAGHRPVWTVQGAVTEVHRIVAPQPREEAVPSVFGIQVRIADVDLVERHRPRIAMRLGLEVDSVPHLGDDIIHRFLLPTAPVPECPPSSNATFDQ